MLDALKKDYSLIYIGLIVISIHMFLIIWMNFTVKTKPMQRKTERLVVKTINLQPRIEEVKKIAPAPAPKVEQKPQPLPAVKKIETKKKPEIKKSPVSKPKPAPSPPKPQISKKQQELMAKARENIANVKLTKLEMPIITSKMLDLPSLKNEGFAEDANYSDELAARLQMMLQLPEIGDVRIKLTLERSGRFLNLEIIEAQSAPNRQYVEKMLPLLNFPPFGNHFTGHSKSVFSITLTNK